MTGEGEDEEWNSIVETTYEVAKEMFGRKKAYDEIIAKGLDIAGEYQNWLGHGGNERHSIYDKVEELLCLWRDEQKELSNLRIKIIRALEKNQRNDSCRALITRLESVTTVAGSPIVNKPGFISSYQQSHNKTLQCISFAVSECCKELNFYIPPDAVQSNLMTQFTSIHDINLFDTPALPKKFSRAILNFENKNIETNIPDMDPQIEITIHEEEADKLDHCQLLDEGYIYNAKTTNGPCYYVYFKIINGQKEQFLCIDATKPFGPKQQRQPIQHVDDSQFTLYRVKVKTFTDDDIDPDIQLLNDIEMILNDK